MIKELEVVVRGGAFVLSCCFLVVTRDVTVLRGGKTVDVGVDDNCVVLVVCVVDEDETVEVETVDVKFCVIGKGTSKYSSGIW